MGGFLLPPGTFSGAVLDTTSFYTIRDQSLEVYDVATGAMTATYPAKAPADEDAPFGLTSISRGVATYVHGNSLHVVRISDGARFKIVKRKNQGSGRRRADIQGALLLIQHGRPPRLREQGKAPGPRRVHADGRRRGAARLVAPYGRQIPDPGAERGPRALGQLCPYGPSMLGP